MQEKLISVYTASFYVDSSFKGDPSIDLDIQYTC
jgi:hypothetical protein